MLLRKVFHYQNQIQLFTGIPLFILLLCTIAGSLDGGRLNFSVRDNGTGFDPTLAPGMEQGHFGIEGIRDRIALLNGTLTIDSARGSGTMATVSLDLADPKEETNE